MKKASLILISVIIMLICLTSAYAADNIVERPDIRIVVDGKQCTFSNVPVSVKDRTMLPLRELLINLGIQNDDQHIVWNGAEDSVTVYKNNIKIYLKVGSNTAYINERPIELQAAPVNYNSRVFIPLRFVSDSLGNTVVWDEATKTALIRDTAEFIKTKALLDKVQAAEATIKKYKFTSEINTFISSNSFKIIGTGETDYDKGIMHTNMEIEALNKASKTEVYLANNALFSKTSTDSKWEKRSIPEKQFKKLLDGQLIMKDRTETLAAGLVIQQDNSSNGILLKGDVFLDDMFKETAADISVYGVEFSKMNLELTIDNNSYLLKSTRVDMESTVKSKTVTQTISQKIICDYSDYNGTFEAVLPDDIK